MLGIHDLWAFLLASFVLWITPGPDTMYILARSVAQGRRAGVLSALGIGSGVVVHTTVAAVGLSALLVTSAWAFTAVRWAGALYLIHLGVSALRSRRQSLAMPSAAPARLREIYRQGVLSNVFNPKVAIFFLSFLPQFVAPEARGPWPFLVLGTAFAVGGTLWCLGVALGAATLTRSLRRRPRALVWLDRVTGGVYIALGLNLLRGRAHAA
jgi:threonine/homoserine/homoserine lactone efflux protein